jgi:hypothetical protein
LARNHLFSLPAAVIQHYKDRAMAEIKQKDGNEAFFTDGGIVAAMTMKGASLLAAILL